MFTWFYDQITNMIKINFKIYLNDVKEQAHYE